MARRATGYALASAVMQLAACSGSNNEPGEHAPLPQVEDNGGGILTAPQIVTVTFAPSLYAGSTGSCPIASSGATALPSGDAGALEAATMVTDLQAFDDGITSTSWWATVTQDYADPKQGPIQQNVAPGAHIAIDSLPPGDGTSDCGTCNSGSATTPVAPCYTDSAIGGSASLKTYLSELFTNATLPAPTRQTLYVFYVPSSVTVSVDGQISCVDIGGYHDSLGVGVLDVPYAIVPICPPEPPALTSVPTLTVEQTATLAASHEIVESTTDPHGGEVPPGGNPFSTTNLGWYLTDLPNQAWGFIAGGEVADLCVDLFALGQDRWPEGDFMYQRVWSNTSASVNHNPCVPVPNGEVYFNAGPAAQGDEQITLSVGGARHYEVGAFSDGSMSAGWSVYGIDVGTTASGQPSTVVTTSPNVSSAATVNEGESVPFTVDLTAEPPSQPGEPPGTPPFEPYIIISSTLDQSAMHYWPAFAFAPN